MEYVKKFKNFIHLHPEFFTIIGLSIAFYFIFFHNIWSYPLMDVDETRYVSMSKDMFNTKDFLTLYLNNEFFFEKPPLYFWSECLSFTVFGKITEFSARFPVALYGVSCCYLLYFVGKKFVSRFYGILASLILATSLEYIILAKFAILDIVVSALVTFSVFSGILIFNCAEKNKKYFWWLFYFFSALAVLAKGIPGFVVPFGTVFCISLIEKKLKDIFKPTYFIIGLTIFLLIVLPWHIKMFELHNPLFWNEYIIKHHVSRFLGGKDIGRTQPFYFYILTILWGFFPYIISVCTVWLKNLIKILKNKSFKINIDNLNTAQKFMLYNTIAALFTFLFFTSSETKLITYILPIYPFLACLGAFIWKDYIKSGKNEKEINIGIYITGSIFIIASVIAIFTPLFLPAQLCQDISIAKTITILLLFATGLSTILFTKKHLYNCVFIVYVLFMLILSGFCTDKFFKIDYKFGQDDLIQFATYAKENNKTLAAFDFTHKYSLIYYGEKPVKYNIQIEDFDKEINLKDNLIIIKIKQLPLLENKNYKILNQGRRYALLEKE